MTKYYNLSTLIDKDLLSELAACNTFLIEALTPLGLLISGNRLKIENSNSYHNYKFLTQGSCIFRDPRDKEITFKGGCYVETWGEGCSGASSKDTSLTASINTSCNKIATSPRYKGNKDISEAVKKASALAEKLDKAVEEAVTKADALAKKKEKAECLQASMKDRRSTATAASSYLGGR